MALPPVYRSGVCQSAPALADPTRVAPLLPPIDQWGALPFPLQHLTPHSLSRRAAALLENSGL